MQKATVVKKPKVFWMRTMEEYILAGGLPEGRFGDGVWDVLCFGASREK
jgi:hypothetical protein